MGYGRPGVLAGEHRAGSDAVLPMVRLPGAGRMISQSTVAFYCPKCGEMSKAELVYGHIFPDPASRPIIVCNVCGAEWCVELKEREGSE